MLAFCVVIAAAYGMIAVGCGNLVVLMRWPLSDIGATPRYHYVGMLPTTILLCLALGATTSLPGFAGCCRHTPNPGQDDEDGVADDCDD